MQGSRLVLRMTSGLEGEKSSRLTITCSFWAWHTRTSIFPSESQSATSKLSKSTIAVRCGMKLPLANCSNTESCHCWSLKISWHHIPGDTLPCSQTISQKAETLILTGVVSSVLPTCCWEEKHATIIMELKNVENTWSPRLGILITAFSNFASSGVPMTLALG